MNKKLTQFWDMIKEDLSVSEFDQLKEALGVKKYKWTALQTGSKDFSPEELNVLSSFLKQPKSELIDKYGLGLQHLSGAEIKAIAVEEQRSITID